MAKVRSGSQERVYNIKRWLGVNEALEGEASLKFGEAAASRNFRVTAGGALQKRPGSKNVAGLLLKYDLTASESAKTLLTTYGHMSMPLLMFSGAVVDSVGHVICSGDHITVSTENADAALGRFFSFKGSVYRFAECVRTQTPGGEQVDGGTVRLGALQRFASGRTDNLSGAEADSGTQQVVTREGLSCVDGSFALSGAETVRERAAGDVPGFVSSGVGGFLRSGGRFWKFFGAKVESFSSGKRWNKFRCVRSEHTSYYTYYSQGGWSQSYTEQLTEGTSSLGYTGYYFSSSSGRFYTSGSYAEVGYGKPGTVYYLNSGDGSTITRITASGNTAVYSECSAQGPYTGSNVSTSYSRGSAEGSVLVMDGQRPESASMSYVTSFSESGVSYTVMRDSTGNYWCYCPAGDSATYFVREYGWYGYPLETAADTYQWRFFEMSARPNSSTDTEVRGLWAGFVGQSEVLCAACNGHLWELSHADGGWSKRSCGTLDTSGTVFMFGFDEKLYVLNGSEYLVWDGAVLQNVEGYRPLVAVASPPSGGGTLLERVNLLTTGRRVRFSPDGSSKTFQLPETALRSVDWVTDLAAGKQLSGFSVDLQKGVVTFSAAPAAGVDSLEIAYSADVSLRRRVTGMRFAELYNGAQDTRVFLYGDGSNKTVYSGLDHDGKARADYFPDLNEAAVGDGNTPITAMIRHYNRLLCFKLDSAWCLYYDAITLTDGTVTAGFYVSPVNRDVGNCAPGQVCLVENRPRTLDGRSVIEWRVAGSSGNPAGDQRNAERISQRVEKTIRSFDLTAARTFYDKITHEYYVIGSGGEALVHNVEADAWYVYSDFPAICMINYKDDVFYGTRDGFLRHFSTDYLSDEGAAIDACWESGAMDFGADFRRKYSAMLWIGIRPEEAGFLTVTAQTDRESSLAVCSFGTADASALPAMELVRLKAKKFTYYKLILRSDRVDSAATVVSADLRVRGAGYVR